MTDFIHMLGEFVEKERGGIIVEARIMRDEHDAALLVLDARRDGWHFTKRYYLKEVETMFCPQTVLDAFEHSIIRVLGE